MSILYKALRRPRTFDEFAKKAKRQGIKKIDVIVEAKEKGLNYCCFVKFRVGNMILKINEYDHERMGDPFSSATGTLIAELDAYKEGVKLAEKLLKLGFEVEVDEESINQAKERIRKGEKQIKRACKKFEMTESAARISNY